MSENENEEWRLNSIEVVRNVASVDHQTADDRLFMFYGLADSRRNRFVVLFPWNDDR